MGINPSMSMCISSRRRKSTDGRNRFLSLNSKNARSHQKLRKGMGSLVVSPVGE
jgi:hypothetical protein